MTFVSRAESLGAACGALVILATATTPSAQEAILAQLLARTGSYVRDSIASLANVVAVEDYVQRLVDNSAMARNEGLGPEASRRLRSDLLLVRYPGDELRWMAFRDVAEVNGTAVKYAGDRLVKLFSEGSNVTSEKAGAIQAESTGYHMAGASYAVTNPFVGVSIAQPSYQPRFRFSLGDADRSLGARVRIVRFQELTEQGGKKLAPLFGAAGRARGSLWVEEDTGRIVKTDTRFVADASTATSTTTFAFDARLGLMLPAEMRTTWRSTRTTTVSGVATYGSFRRFEVHTESSPPSRSK